MICILNVNTQMIVHPVGGSNYDSLFVRTVAFPVQVAYWIKEVIAPCETSVPCQLRPVVRRHGRGVLWTGGNPCMTGCPLQKTRLLLAQKVFFFA